MPTQTVTEIEEEGRRPIIGVKRNSLKAKGSEHKAYSRMARLKSGQLTYATTAGMQKAGTTLKSCISDPHLNWNPREGDEFLRGLRSGTCPRCFHGSWPKGAQNLLSCARTLPAFMTSVNRAVQKPKRTAPAKSSGKKALEKEEDRTGNNKNLFNRTCQELQEMNRKAAKRAGEIRLTFQSPFSSLIA